MKNLIGVLLFIWAGGWLVSCESTETEPEVFKAQVIERDECDSAKGTAVTVNLNYENSDATSTGVKIIYRQDDGNWQELNEFVSGAAIIPGSAGTYDIKAQRDGYILESATVIVPNDQDCRVLNQEVTFWLTEAVCSEVIPIAVAVKRPAVPEGLTVSVRFPGSDPNERPCDPDVCTFNLSPTDLGTYEVIYSGFSNDRSMVLDQNIIHYQYNPVELVISVENRRHHVVSEAVDSLNLGIPYGLAENGCYEVDFYGITAESTSMSIADPGSIREHTNLVVHDLTSPVCSQAEIQTKRVHFNVDVPTGKNVNDITVEYWKGGSWQTAECEFHNGYQCVAEYSNPLIADKYHVRTMIKDQAYLGAFRPLEGKCMSFE